MILPRIAGIRWIVWTSAATMIGCAFSVTVLGQTLPSIDTRLLSLTEALRQHGIGTGPAELIAALKSGDPYVRSLAAHKLAEDRDVDAIPIIEAALVAEVNPRARIGLAGALAAFDDPKGVVGLHAVCTDTTIPVAAVLEATTYLQMAHLPSAVCASALLAYLTGPNNGAYRDTAISVVANLYREIRGEQALRIVGVVESMLKDSSQQPSVRLAASHAVLQMGAISSVDALKVATAREGDAGLKAIFQADLDSLEKRQ